SVGIAPGDIGVRVDEGDELIEAGEGGGIRRGIVGISYGGHEAVMASGRDVCLGPGDAGIGYPDDSPGRHVRELGGADDVPHAGGHEGGWRRPVSGGGDIGRIAAAVPYAQVEVVRLARR